MHFHLLCVVKVGNRPLQNIRKIGPGVHVLTRKDASIRSDVERGVDNNEVQQYSSFHNIIDSIYV